MKNYLKNKKFKNIELAGFDVKGINPENKTIIAKVNDNLSVMYLAKAELPV